MLNKNREVLFFMLLLVSSNITFGGETQTSSLSKPNSFHINDEDKFIFQDETTFMKHSIYQSFGLSYYTKDWSIGIQSLNYHIGGSEHTSSYESDTYLVGSYTLHLIEPLSLGIGSKIGTSFDNASRDIHYVGYIDIYLTVLDNFSLYSGLVYVNDYLTLENNRRNFLVESGLNYQNDVISTSLGYVSGQSVVSGVSLSVSFNHLFKNFRPYLSLQANNPPTNLIDSSSVGCGFTYKLPF